MASAWTQKLPTNFAHLSVNGARVAACGWGFRRGRPPHPSIELTAAVTRREALSDNILNSSGTSGIRPWPISHQTSTADLRAVETRIVKGRQVRDIEMIIDSEL